MLEGSSLRTSTGERLLPGVLRSSAFGVNAASFCQFPFFPTSKMCYPKTLVG